MLNVQNESNYYALKCNSELDKMYIQVALIWAKPSIAPLKLNEMKAILKKQKIKLFQGSQEMARHMLFRIDKQKAYT